VATRVGGIPELITADSGILIDCGDVDGLAGAIQALATDPNLRVGLGQSARMRACTDFSFDSMVDEYDYFYRRVLRRGSPDTVAPEAIIRP
jgi:glycosyltransferase involved in cell wall biosynthesis